jgi:hypothetical protein
MGIPFCWASKGVDEQLDLPAAVHAGETYFNFVVDGGIGSCQLVVPGFAFSD